MDKEDTRKRFSLGKNEDSVHLDVMIPQELKNSLMDYCTRNKETLKKATNKAIKAMIKNENKKGKEDKE